MRALVTGGGGFLGSAIVRGLIARGDEVHTFARGAYPELSLLGAHTVRGDLRDADAVCAATAGCDVVYHVGALAGIGARGREYAETNIGGTANVLAACRAHGVPRLVYTSTSSVVATHDGIAGGDESLPYPARYESPYAATKAAAERAVLAADGLELATVALRPHLIWGPGDTQLGPRIVERGRRGRLRFVGDGTNLVDSTYIDNAVSAHLAAADRLHPGAAISGRAYFVSQGEPRPIRDLVLGVLAAAGVDNVPGTVPFPVAYALGALAEGVFVLTRRPTDPPMTRFLARQLATPHWFDIAAARRDLGYIPAVDIATGMVRLREHLRG